MSFGIVIESSGRTYSAKEQLTMVMAELVNKKIIKRLILFNQILKKSLCAFNCHKKSKDPSLLASLNHRLFGTISKA